MPAIPVNAMTPHVLSIADLHNVKGELRVAKGTIVTPAAQDHADTNGIRIVIVDSPPSNKAPTATSIDRTTIAKRIDHTLLHPDAVVSDVLNLCAEALAHGFAAVCVNPIWANTVAKALHGSKIATCVVVGFPTGAHHTAIKVAEAEVAAREGATEIDLVANTGWLKSGRFRDYTDDIAAVRRRLGSGLILKVIIEAGLLTPEQIVRAATLAVEAGCDYVKTSTGIYGKVCADHVRLLRRALPATIKVKAAGGIRTAQDLQQMVTAGADRIGTSNSVAIVWELNSSS